jgi:hypothetical protein
MKVPAQSAGFFVGRACLQKQTLIGKKYYKVIETSRVTGAVALQIRQAPRYKD